MFFTSQTVLFHYFEGRSEGVCDGAEVVVIFEDKHIFGIEEVFVILSKVYIVS